jgi:hypothetical protein
MRAVILVSAAAALSLAACRNNDQADNTANVDENLAAENIVSNDVTAIDAVTGAAANMAADVNYIEVANNLSAEANSAASKKPTPRTPAPGKPPLQTPAPAESNTATE